MNLTGVHVELTVTGHPVFGCTWNHMVCLRTLVGAGHRLPAPPLTRWLLPIPHRKLWDPNLSFVVCPLSICPFHLHDDRISSGNVFLITILAIDAQIPTGVDIIADVLDGSHTSGWSVSSTNYCNAHNTPILLRVLEHSKKSAPGMFHILAIHVAPIGNVVNPNLRSGRRSQQMLGFLTTPEWRFKANASCEVFVYKL